MKAIKKERIKIAPVCLAVAAAVVLLTFLTRGLLDMINGLDVSVESFSGETFSLGKYTGLRNELSYGFSGDVFNVDKLIESVKKSDLYDDNLSFEKADGSRLIYLVGDGKAYSLRIHGLKCELKELFAAYQRQSFSVIADVYGDGYRAPSGYQTGEWRDDDIGFNDIKYLYGKMPDDMCKICDDAVYLKGYVLPFPELMDKTDGYVARIVEKEGRICVEVISGEVPNE